MRYLGENESKKITGAFPTKDYFSELPKGLIVSELKRGEMLFSEGSRPEGIYILLQGSVLLSMHDEKGSKQAIVILDAPAMFGELELLQVLPQTVEVMALERCVFYSVSSAEAKALIAADPVFSQKLLFSVARRSALLSYKLMRASCCSLRQRLAEFILDTERDGVYRETDSFAASYLGATERRIRSVMGEIRKFGAIEKRGREDVILDFALLQSISGKI